MTDVIKTSEEIAPMDTETLKALRGSIAKWEGIVAGTVADEGGENCPLCQMFVLESETASCTGCPVAARTGRDDCYRSPYITEWNRLNPWPEDANGVQLWSRKVQTEEHRAAAQAELDFLKSLLPAGEVP